MQFSVWAPQAKRLGLQVDQSAYGMERDPTRPGWWTAEAEAGQGARYGYVVDGAGPYPDPRSRRQPNRALVAQHVQGGEHGLAGGGGDARFPVEDPADGRFAHPRLRSDVGKPCGHATGLYRPSPALPTARAPGAPGRTSRYGLLPHRAPWSWWWQELAESCTSRPTSPHPLHSAVAGRSRPGYGAITIVFPCTFFLQGLSQRLQRCYVPGRPAAATAQSASRRGGRDRPLYHSGFTLKENSCGVA